MKPLTSPRISPRSSISDSEKSGSIPAQSLNSSGLGPDSSKTFGLVSPRSAGEVSRRPSNSMKDTTPRRTPSIAVQDIKELIGDLDTPPEDSTHFNADDSNDEDDDEDDSNDDEDGGGDGDDGVNGHYEGNTDPVLGAGDRGSALLDGVSSEIQRLSNLLSNVCDIADQHTEYLHSIDNSVSETRKHIASKEDHGEILKSWLSKVTKGDSVQGAFFHNILYFYSAIGKFPLIGPVLQLIVAANALCCLRFFIPQILWRSLFHPIIGLIQSLCRWFFFPLLDAIPVDYFLAVLANQGYVCKVQ